MRGKEGEVESAKTGRTGYMTWLLLLDLHV